MKRNVFIGRYKTLIVSLVLIFLFLLNGKLVGAEEVRGVTDDALKVGVILDQTGPASNVSVPVTNSLKRYFRYINLGKTTLIIICIRPTIIN